MSEVCIVYKHVSGHSTALHTIRKNLQHGQTYKSAKQSGEEGARLMLAFVLQV